MKTRFCMKPVGVVGSVLADTRIWFICVHVLIIRLLITKLLCVLNTFYTNIIKPKRLFVCLNALVWGLRNYSFKLKNIFCVEYPITIGYSFVSNLTGWNRKTQLVYIYTTNFKRSSVGVLSGVRGANKTIQTQSPNLNKYLYSSTYFMIGRRTYDHYQISHSILSLR